MFTVTFLKTWEPVIEVSNVKIVCDDYPKGTVLHIISPSSGITLKKNIGQRLFVGLKHDIYDLEKQGIVTITNN